MVRRCAFVLDNGIRLTFEQFVKIFRAVGGEPEFRVYFRGTDNEYMIIKYDDHVSFQRCGVKNGSGEIDFKDIDTLYHAETIDGICLERDWENISEIVVDGWYSLSVKDDLQTLCDEHGITL